MMDDFVVERKFLASLHRALEDVAPEKLEIFEKWFNPADRRPRFHIAPVIGAVSYLRRTPALYRRVMEKAGQYASQWSCLALPRIERIMVRLPIPFLRDRMLKRLLMQGIRSIHRDGKLEIAREGERLVFTLSNSLFCRTGGPLGDEPACEYYAALFAGLLAACTHEQCTFITEFACRGLGDAACQFEALP